MRAKASHACVSGNDDGIATPPKMNALAVNIIYSARKLSRGRNAR